MYLDLKLSTYYTSTNTSWSKGLLLIWSQLSARLGELGRVPVTTGGTNGHLKYSTQKTDTCDQLAISACPSISRLGAEASSLEADATSLHFYALCSIRTERTDTETSHLGL